MNENIKNKENENTLGVGKNKKNENSLDVAKNKKDGNSLDVAKNKKDGNAIDVAREAEEIKKQLDKEDGLLKERNNADKNGTDNEKKFSENKIFGVIVAIILIAMIAIFLIPKIFKEKPMTIEDTLKNIAQDGGNNDDANDEAYNYNGFSFVKQLGMWYTQIVDPASGYSYTVPLHFSPKEVDEIDIKGKDKLNSFMFKCYNNNLSNQTNHVYITFDPRGQQLGFVGLASAELGINFAEVFNIAYLPACTSDHEGCKDAKAILTCENTTAPTIYFKESDETGVKVDDFCLTIQGSGYGIVKAADRLLYELYHII